MKTDYICQNYLVSKDILLHKFWLYYLNRCGPCTGKFSSNYDIRGGSRISGKGVHVYKGVGGSVC